MHATVQTPSKRSLDGPRSRLNIISKDYQHRLSFKLTSCRTRTQRIIWSTHLSFRIKTRKDWTREDCKLNNNNIYNIIGPFCHGNITIRVFFTSQFPSNQGTEKLYPQRFSQLS